MQDSFEVKNSANFARAHSCSGARARHAVAPIMIGNGNALHARKCKADSAMGNGFIFAGDFSRLFPLLSGMAVEAAVTSTTTQACRMKKPIAISTTNSRMSAARPNTADHESPNTDDFDGEANCLRFCATRTAFVTGFRGHSSAFR